ncbi:MAG: pilin [Gammaproteobacteria bacterium]
MFKYNTKKYQSGFTLMELMIVVAIVGILAAIAIPSYQDYTRRARYTEIVAAADPAKIGVNDCFQSTGSLNGCLGGSNGVPPNWTAPAESTGNVSTVAVAGNGIITVTPRTGVFLVTDTYVLTPTAQTPTVTGSSATAVPYLTWIASGGGVAKGYARAQ